MASLLRELLLIPCCATKKPEGRSSAIITDLLSNLVSASAYSDILKGRQDVLSSVCQNGKNRSVESGADFGGYSTLGRYLPAVDRYEGTLYANVPASEDTSWRQDDRHVLILSALYGPLHPLSSIQNYNLKMSDRSAYGVWKKRFPRFLQDYVSLNGIHSIYLFFGTTTCYLKVARCAVEPLLAGKQIAKAIQYHIINGGTRLTPQCHGKLFAKHLESGKIVRLPENVEARPI